MASERSRHIAQAYAEGLSTAEIVAKFDCSNDTIRWACKITGTKRRPTGHRSPSTTTASERSKLIAQAYAEGLSNAEIMAKFSIRSRCTIEHACKLWGVERRPVGHQSLNTMRRIMGEI